MCVTTWTKHTLNRNRMQKLPNVVFLAHFLWEHILWHNYLFGLHIACMHFKRSHCFFFFLFRLRRVVIVMMKKNTRAHRIHYLCGVLACYPLNSHQPIESAHQVLVFNYLYMRVKWRWQHTLLLQLHNTELPCYINIFLDCLWLLVPMTIFFFYYKNK